MFLGTSSHRAWPQEEDVGHLSGENINKPSDVVLVSCQRIFLRIKWLLGKLIEGSSDLHTSSSIKVTRPGVYGWPRDWNRQIQFWFSHLGLNGGKICMYKSHLNHQTIYPSPWVLISKSYHQDSHFSVRVSGWVNLKNPSE